MIRWTDDCSSAFRQVCKIIQGCPKKETRINAVQHTKEVKKMKATFKSYMHGYTGKLDGIVYYYHPIKQICMGRRYVKPQESTANIRLRAVMANLKLLQPSEGYINDIKHYIFRYNDKQPSKKNLLISWNNLFVKLMFAMVKANPNVDLATLSREQVFAQDLPCQSVKKAVDAGLLPAVLDCEWLTKTI